MSIEAVIYDLDETIIETGSLHEQGWMHALKLFNIVPSAEWLLFQRGKSGEDALKGILPEELYVHMGQIRDTKATYVLEHLGEVKVYAGFAECSEELQRRGIKQAICTSARPDFIQEVVRQVPPLAAFEGKIVGKGMYAKGKPAPDPLLATLKLLGNVESHNAFYVGDAQSDYLCAQNAGVEFVYFCSDVAARDERIPGSVKQINDHRELLPYVR